MELKTNLRISRILKLIHQLPKQDIERLSEVLQSEIFTQKPSGKLQNLLLDAPTWTETELQNYVEARNHINQSRIA